MASAYVKAQKLQIRLERAGIILTTDQANILRRAERTLHTWGEQECGDGNDHASWAIERDEKTGKPYRCVYPHNGPSKRYPIADREKGALRRVAKVCMAHELHYFHQADPRGCALYIAREPLTDTNYSSRGIAVCD